MTESAKTAAGVNPRIGESWKARMLGQFSQPYFMQLKRFLVAEKKEGREVFPPGRLIFNAFNRTPFDSVKAVIMGQDPYHGRGQANGLCFSVAPGIRMPPSLINIFKELQADLGYDPPLEGNLEKWADQGVLLLNASLTVRAHSPNSHSGKGWEIFTDAVIKTLSDQRTGLVFLLWGKNAQAKEMLIDTSKHYLLKAAHPSPYSAASGFFGCRHFSKTNALLRQQGIQEINWSL